ncbi:MAG: cytochrome c biogenesis protein CcdA [Ignavibacteria bacterium]|nr:cytochrome c biogenesis protein CcdA [Ignavibacteria bacterium]
MINDLFTFLSEALYQNFWMALLASFAWGILSILLSPCHLSSIPLLVGYITRQGKVSVGRTFSISLLFAVGILITIALVGIITASLGRLMGDVGTIGTYIVAGLFFIIGLYLLDIIKLPLDVGSVSPVKQKGLFAALILGLLFGIALGPCTFAYMAPILGLVFTMSSENIFGAGLLLLFFGLGHCSVIVGAGTLTSKVQKYLDWSENSKTTNWIKRICGVLVILGGVYLIYSVS